MTSKSVFVTHSWHSLFSLSHTHRPAASKANGATSGTHSGGGGSRSRANMSAYASGITVGAAAGSGGVRVMLEGKNVTPQSLLRPVQRGKNGANNANNSSAVAVGVDGAAAAAAAAAVQGEAERRRSSNKLSSNSGQHLHKICFKKTLKKTKKKTCTGRVGALTKFCVACTQCWQQYCCTAQ
jgi:hypothetical protein